MRSPFFRTKMRVIPYVLLSVFTLPTVVTAETELRDTVVTATRSAAPIDELPVTVTAITRDSMDRRLPMDEADFFRDEPDIAMARDLRRFGSTRVNIRGIEDNRVVTMVDGVRLPDFYNGGGPTNFTMSGSPSVFPDFLKQVEIVRGPASSLYGSDALGGVVGFVTLDPADITSQEKGYGVRVRGGYTGANEQFSSSVVGALRGEVAEFLIGYGEARGHETKTKGSNDSTSPLRDKANPADTEDRGMIAKLILKPAVGHKFSATVERREQNVESDIRRLSSSLPRITQMLGDDTSERTRFSLEYEHKPTGAFYDRMIARVYYQDSETRNDNYNRRSNTTSTCSAASAGANQCDVYQAFHFDQKTTGANLQFESLLGSSVTHLFTYGLDLMQQEVEELRDATRYNLTTGTVSKTIAGETFPLRDFANGKTETIGLFLQDEIALIDGQLKLTPGVRYDRTTLKPEVDALSQPLLTATNRQLSEQTYSHLSPKLGAQWKFNEVLSTYGQLATGFRAPNYNEVNGAFRNAGVPPGYGITPNPDLKPETSIGFELGLRARSATAHGQVAIYDNRYKDFIERMTLSCPGNPSCIAGVATTYQSQNLSRVRIYGAEIRAAWDFMPNWRIDGALAYAHGTDEERNQPLNSIEPLRLSLGLAHDVGSWGAEARMRAAARKSRIDDSAGTASDPAYFRTPGYGVTDLAAWVRPSRNTRISVALNNVFDKKYWLWSDIRQADALNPAGVDFYSQPGRNFRVAFQADF